MNQAILVDYSWVYHKSFHTFKDFSWKVGEELVPTGPMYGTIRDITALRDAFPGSPIFVAIEPENNNTRYQFNPEYKAGRPKRDPLLFRVYSATLQALSLFNNVTIVSSDQDGESDDVIYSMIQQMGGVADRILVFANDNDLLQSAADPILKGKVCYYHIYERKMTLFEDYCQEKYGVSPAQILLYRSIIGDSSDNLHPVVPRFPRELAKTLVSMTDSPQVLLESLSQSMKGEEKVWKASHLRYLEELLKGQQAFLNNYQIMKLRPIQVTVENYKDPTKTVDYFVKMYGMGSLRKIHGEIKGIL